jgi:Dna[CI] antecedent, DciA
MRRSNTSFSVLQASLDSPTLAHLVDLSAQTSACLRCITSLLPPGLRPGVQAGPLEGQVWCLLVDSTAIAAKLRQLQPLLLERLAREGHDITAIRLKVRAASASG